MRGIFARVRCFCTSDDGPTTTEYAVMLALIIVICVAAISGIGQTVGNIFSNTDSGLPTGSSS